MIAPLALLALAAAAPAPEPANPYAGLWTGWGEANRDSVAAETRASEQVRRQAEAADAATAHRAAAHGRALGERVGEIVRLGDCAEGERLARAAGDFPLVAAVRAHCGLASAPTP